MFKKILVAIACATMITVSMPSEAKFGSSPSASRASTPTARPSMAPSGGMSGGKAIGMQRSNVTNTVRQPAAPVSNYNGNAGNTYRPQTYQQPQVIHNTTVIHHGSTGSSGFGMGSLAMAAMGGYMLNGVLHDHSGGVYNGPGYSNGQPIAGGQYAPVMDSNGQQQPTQVIVQQVPVSNPVSGWTILCVLLFSIVLVIVLVRVVL